MPTLELVLDATGMQRGAQQAEASLKGVQVTAEKTQASVTALGGGLRNTFQAVQGVSQVGQGIASTARAFEGANIAAGAFAASFTLLEIGKTAKDFRDMGSTVTTVTHDIYGMATSMTRAATAFEILGTVVKAHPLLTVATVIGAAAGLMALFSNNTKSAAQSFDELASSMAKARLDEDTARFLGVSGNKKSDELSRLFALTQYARSPSAQDSLYRPGLTVSGLQNLLSETDRDRLLTELNRAGNPYALRALETGETPSIGSREMGIPNIPVRNAELQQLLRNRYRDLSTAPTGGPATGRMQFPGWMIPTQPFGTPDKLGLGVGRDYVSISAAQQKDIDRDNAQQAAERIAESMERAARSAEQIGGAFGAAAFDVLAGVQSLRQALLGIVSSLGRQGLSSLGSQLFGATVRQAQGNTNPTGGGDEPPYYIAAR